MQFNQRLALADGYNNAWLTCIVVAQKQCVAYRQAVPIIDKKARFARIRNTVVLMRGRRPVTDALNYVLPAIFCLLPRRDDAVVSAQPRNSYGRLWRIRLRATMLLGGAACWRRARWAVAVMCRFAR